MPEIGAIPLLAGPELSDAGAVLILLHGRGATARGMLPLAAAAAGAETSVLVPEARGNTWYPNRFLVERQANEPWLSEALETVYGLVRASVEAGVPTNRIAVAGFSQGACLALEFVARHPARYAGAVAFAGALVGPDPLTGSYVGDLDGTPIHIAVGERDEHVPPDYVRASAEVLRIMGAAVAVRIHEEMGHGIHPDDVLELARMLQSVIAP